MVLGKFFSKEIGPGTLPQTPGFIALSPIPRAKKQYGEQNGVPLLALRLGLGLWDRRSGRFPALPYPPPRSVA